MTEDQQQLCKQLRTEGLSYLKIAKRIGVSETTVFKFFKPPKPKPPSQKPKPKSCAHALLPRTLYHGSVPIRRTFPSIMLHLPKETREELYHRLATAVRNTVRLSHR